MSQNVPKLLFSKFSKTTAVISVLLLIFGIFSLCRIPKKQEEYQQAQAQYAVDLETRTREVSAEIDEYIKTGPPSMNDIPYAHIAHNELYVVNPTLIFGPYAMKKTTTNNLFLQDSIITKDQFFYALYYTDGNNVRVGVILESFRDDLKLDNLPDTLYVSASLTSAKSTFPDANGEYTTSYSALQELDPSAECISLSIMYNSREDFVEDQEESIPRLAAAPLTSPSDEALTKTKRNAKNAFIFAAIMIPVTLFNMRVTASKKEQEAGQQDAF